MQWQGENTWLQLTISSGLTYNQAKCLGVYRLYHRQNKAEGDKITEWQHVVRPSFVIMGPVDQNGEKVWVCTDWSRADLSRDRSQFRV